MRDSVPAIRLRDKPFAAIGPDPQTPGVERLSDKLLNWASILDDGTLKQAERTASLDIVDPHVALTGRFTA